MNYRYYEAYREVIEVLESVKTMRMAKPRSALLRDIDRRVKDVKWNALLKQNLKMVKPSVYEWAFDLHSLLENNASSGANHIGNWNTNFGLWGGRSLFVFPEYSRWVHLATNTLPMHKVCVKTRGWGKDIYSIQGDENPMNHWIYENSELSWAVGQKLSNYLALYDGVHVLLSDRNNLGREFIPDRPLTRANPDFVYTDYVPAHHHHNWRFKA